MRILMISSEFPPGPGGIGTHAFQLAQQLHRRGHELTVLTAQHYATAAELAEFNRRQPFAIAPFRDLPSPPLKAWGRYGSMRRQLRRLKPDIVVATGKRAVWIAAAAMRDQTAPWIAVGHGTEFGVRSVWERKLVVASFGRATAVICVSQFTAAQMRACGVRPRAIQVIPNGADSGMFRVLPSAEVEQYRRSLGFGRDRLLLTVGHVSERKGQEVVIRAMPRILQRYPDTRYLMAGLPTERPRLEQIATSLGVQDRVHFLGRVSSGDLVRLMNCCDLFLMTSRTTESGDCEGFGIAAVEAALCGKASVVSRTSGLAEAVRHNQTGLCVPEGDPGAVADAVVALFGDEAWLRSLATAARQRALAEQTWDHRIEEYETLLCQLTGRAKVSPPAEKVAPR